MSDMPTSQLPITLGIATYNNHDDVGELVASINSQRGVFNVVVCDGGSDERFLEILRGISQPLTIVTSPRKGIYDAYNQIIDRVEDGWIVLFGADDRFYEPCTIERMAATLQDTPSDSVVAGKALTQAYGDFYYVNSLSRIFTLALLAYENTIHHQSVCVHKRYYGRHGVYSTDYRVVSDHKMLIEAWQRGNLQLVDQIWSVSKRGGVSTSAANRNLVSDEIDGIRKMLGSANWRMRLMSQCYRLYRLMSVVRWQLGVRGAQR